MFCEEIAWGSRGFGVILIELSEGIMMYRQIGIRGQRRKVRRVEGEY